MDLATLKRKYSEIEKKYKLPSFERLNENFEIEKIDKDTDLIARAVRKIMIDKIVNSLNFLEMMINQVNVPRLYLSFLRTMTLEERKSMEEMYFKLGELSLISLNLEIDYSEKQEVESIKKIHGTWISIKPSFKKILAKIMNPDTSQMTYKKEKSYFG